MKVVTVDEMRHIETQSDAGGHSYEAMMEQAGRAVAGAIIARRDVKGRPVLVLVGPGNNGGDGLVAARYLTKAGARVTCYLLRSRDPAEDKNFRLVQEGEMDVLLAEEDGDRDDLRSLARKAVVIIDALLGTGTRLPLRGTLAEILDVVGQNLSTRKEPRPTRLTSLASGFDSGAFDRAFVVGVDGPTGLDYESGELDKVALSADLTVTFAYPKRGHFRFPGAGALGELVVADIGTDSALAEDIPLEVVTPALVRSWLPERPMNAHKGTFGRAMIAAGSVNYTGAAYLSGASAARAGVGLVTMALPAAIHEAVAAQLPEATYLLLPNELGVIAEGAARVLIERLDDYDALLVGPGLGQEQETVGFVTALLDGVEERHAVGFGGAGPDQARRHTLPPLVIDADGLNILSRLAEWPKRLPSGTILTPHPGEMARLMAAEIESVQADRVAVAREQAAAWGHVIVLKGAYTVVAAPDGRAVIEPFANPGLATAGTGDVLAGTVVSLRAQGLDAFEAAAVGAYLHGLAGEWARKEMGVAGMVAGDVLARLPRAWQCVTLDH